MTGSQAGTHTVNCNGTGVISRILTQSNGTSSLGVDDFVITGAIVSTNGSAYTTNWSLVATSIIDAQRTPSAIVPGGIFLTRSYTRLPDIDK